MAEKTLYISDLDGTLLRNDQTLSPYTVQAIHALVEKGMIFSYATARSFITAKAVTGGLPSGLPAVVYNGSFIIEQGTGERLCTNAFSEEDGKMILDCLLAREVYPIVYAFVDGKEKYSWCPHLESRGTATFNNTRHGDIRENPVAELADLYRGEIFHFTCIDEPEKLAPLYEYFREKFPCVFHVDIYSGEQWLEIQPLGATKAEAILKLKEMLNCDRIVCFGDGKNDISMFRIADECYAMANAEEELKAIATAVIDSNENHGVAKWLLENYRR
jgi:Cof subfamily protein (haloacid dehalogenase superfamily)